MRWNPFRRSESAAAESAFETTVVDDVAAARAAASHAAAPMQAPAAAPSPAPAAAPKGLIVDSESIGHVGRYALKAVLGKGGLGTVYAAWDPLLSRTVALKTLHVDADPAVRDSMDTLFLNEARAAAGLSHPHIVTVFDAGPSPNGVYIAMERLQGQDLRHLLQQGVRPGPIEAAQVVRRVADALAYAHRKGVVHCDVKPANIFMTGRMHPKVLDFGIARVAHREATPTLEGMFAGSPYYLAPEQVDGASVDRRSDVYSLGVVLYELLTGRKPFEGSSLEEITRAVKAGNAQPAHRVSPKVPLGLSVIAGRAMARDPDQRYPSARHLSMELRHWVESAEARALLNGGARTPKPPRGLRIARIAVPFAALGLAGGLWWWKTLQSEDAPIAGASPAPAVASAPAALPASVAQAAPAAVAEASAAVASALPEPASASAPGAAAAPDTAPVASAASASATATATAAQAASKADARRRAKANASAASDAAPAAVAAAPAVGVVQLAVSPWGQVEVDGRAMGTSPPLTRLTLAAGSHTITVRNADYPAYTATIAVSGDNPATLRHRFGP